MIICRYSELVYDSKTVLDRKIQEIKELIRESKVVVIDFEDVSNIDCSWLYRLYVSVYRELRYDEAVDDRLIVKNISYAIKPSLEDVKKKARVDVWGTFNSNNHANGYRYLNIKRKRGGHIINNILSSALEIVKEIIIIFWLIMCNVGKQAITLKEKVQSFFELGIIFMVMLLLLVISYIFLINASIINVLAGGEIIGAVVVFFAGVLIEIIVCYFIHGIVKVYSGKIDFRKILQKILVINGDLINIVSLLAILAALLSKQNADDLNINLLTVALVLVSYNISVEIYAQFIADSFDTAFHEYL